MSRIRKHLRALGAACVAALEEALHPTPGLLVAVLLASTYVVFVVFVTVVTQ